MISLPVGCQKFYFWCFICQTCLKNIWCFSCCSVWCSVNTDRKYPSAAGVWYCRRSQAHIRNQLQVEGGLTEVFQTELRFWTWPPHHSQSDQVLSLTLGANAGPELTLSCLDQPEVHHQKPEEAEWHHIQSCDPESDSSDQQRKKSTCESVELLSDFKPET